MQHANRLDSGSRTAPSPTPLPTPPDSATQSPFDRRTMSPVEGRPSPYRKASRGSSSAGIRSASDDTKLFMFESDASTDKYMHYYDQLSDRLDVPRPTAVEHQVKHDPSGTLKTWEYELPKRMWPPVKETAKCQDTSLKIRWGRENGYVQITNIGKALLILNLKMSEFLKGYDDQIVRIRGGQIEVQGSWIPYDLARKICLQKCYKIRRYLAPLFGPDFVNECRPAEPEEERMKRRPGRRPRSPIYMPVKRSPDEMLEDDFDQTDMNEYLSKKRRSSPPSTSGSLSPPSLPSDLHMDMFGDLSKEELCSTLSAARELTRLQHCPFQGPPHNEWPMQGDSRLGGHVWYRGRRYQWNGATDLVEDPSTPNLPPVKDLVPSAPSPKQFIRYPMTPSPRQSPYMPPVTGWQSPFSAPAGHTLISPPLSLRESFSGHGRERQYSVVTTDECRTPSRELYFGSLFPTPQPEGRHDRRYED